MKLISILVFIFSCFIFNFPHAEVLSNKNVINSGEWFDGNYYCNNAVDNFSLFVKPSESGGVTAEFYPSRHQSTFMKMEGSYEKDLDSCPECYKSGHASDIKINLKGVAWNLPEGKLTPFSVFDFVGEQANQRIPDRESNYIRGVINNSTECTTLRMARRGSIQSNKYFKLKEQAFKSCANAKIPNPNPQPDETSDFYGLCANGNAISGVVVWKVGNKTQDISILDDGSYISDRKLIDEYRGEEWSGATRFLRWHPDYCENNNFIGICDKNSGVNIGHKVITVSPKTDRHPGVKSFYNGGFKNGDLQGFGTLNTFDMNAFGASPMETKVGYFNNGKLYVECKNASDCEPKVRSVPLFEAAKVLAKQLRCEDALKKDIEAQNVLKINTSSNGYEINYSGCIAEKKFQDILMRKDPKSMYITAGLYESDGERGRAKTIYKKIIESFSSHPMALNAADRLTRLGDVEAVESSNRDAGNAASNAASSVNERNYQQCQKNQNACYARCSSLSGKAYLSCQSGCASCQR